MATTARGKRDKEEDEFSAETVSVSFDKQLLWALHKVLRHEVWQEREWNNPSSSLNLNDKLAEALLMCEEQNQDIADLQLTLRECYAIDSSVDDNYQDLTGRWIGREIQLKQFWARGQHFRRELGFDDAPLDSPDLSYSEALEEKRKRNGITSTDSSASANDADAT